MVQQEISTLHTQLAKVRSDKHQAETERAECGKIQDEMIQKLQARVQELVGSLGSDAGEHIRRAMDPHRRERKFSGTCVCKFT